MDEEDDVQSFTGPLTSEAIDHLEPSLAAVAGILDNLDLIPGNCNVFDNASNAQADVADSVDLPRPSGTRLEDYDLFTFAHRFGKYCSPVESVDVGDIFSKPRLWGITMSTVNDFLQHEIIQDENGVVSISAACMAIVCLAEVGKEPEAEKLLPIVNWTLICDIRNTLSHRGKFPSKITLYDEQQNLFQLLQDDLSWIKNCFEHCLDDVTRQSICNKGHKWNGLKEVNKLLNKHRDWPLSHSEKPPHYVGLKLKQARLVVRHLGDYYNLELRDALRNRDNRKLYPYQAAISYVFVDLISLLNDFHLLPSSVLVVCRNFLGHSNAHVSERYICKVVSSFFSFVLESEANASSLTTALHYKCWFQLLTQSDDKNEIFKTQATEAAQYLNTVIRSFPSSSPVEIHLPKVTELFPLIGFDKRGFFLLCLLFGEG